MPMMSKAVPTGYVAARAAQARDAAANYAVVAQAKGKEAAERVVAMAGENGAKFNEAWWSPYKKRCEQAGNVALGAYKRFHCADEAFEAAVAELSSMGIELSDDEKIDLKIRIMGEWSDYKTRGFDHTGGGDVIVSQYAGALREEQIDVAHRVLLMADAASRFENVIDPFVRAFFRHMSFDAGYKTPAVIFANTAAALTKFNMHEHIALMSARLKEFEPALREQDIIDLAPLEMNIWLGRALESASRSDLSRARLTDGNWNNPNAGKGKGKIEKCSVKPQNILSKLHNIIEHAEDYENIVIMAPFNVTWPLNMPASAVDIIHKFFPSGGDWFDANGDVLDCILDAHTELDSLGNAMTVKEAEAGENFFPPHVAALAHRAVSYFSGMAEDVKLLLKKPGDIAEAAAEDKHIEEMDGGTAREDGSAANILTRGLSPVRLIKARAELALYFLSRPEGDSEAEVVQALLRLVGFIANVMDEDYFCNMRREAGLEEVPSSDAKHPQGSKAAFRRLDEQMTWTRALIGFMLNNASPSRHSQLWKIFGTHARGFQHDVDTFAAPWWCGANYETAAHAAAVPLHSLLDIAYELAQLPDAPSTMCRALEQCARVQPEGRSTAVAAMKDSAFLAIVMGPDLTLQEADKVMACVEMKASGILARSEHGEGEEECYGYRSIPEGFPLPNEDYMRRESFKILGKIMAETNPPKPRRTMVNDVKLLPNVQALVSNLAGFQGYTRKEKLFHLATDVGRMVASSGNLRAQGPLPTTEQQVQELLSVDTVFSEAHGWIQDDDWLELHEPPPALDPSKDTFHRSHGGQRSLLSMASPSPSASSGGTEASHDKADNTGKAVNKPSSKPTGDGEEQVEQRLTQLHIDLADTTLEAIVQRASSLGATLLEITHAMTTDDTLGQSSPKTEPDARGALYWLIAMQEAAGEAIPSQASPKRRDIGNGKAAATSNALGASDTAALTHAPQPWETFGIIEQAPVKIEPDSEYNSPTCNGLNCDKPCQRRTSRGRSNGKFFDYHSRECARANAKTGMIAGSRCGAVACVAEVRLCHKTGKPLPFCSPKCKWHDGLVSKYFRGIGHPNAIAALPPVAAGASYCDLPGCHKDRNKDFDTCGKPHTLLCKFVPLVSESRRTAEYAAASPPRAQAAMDLADMGTEELGKHKVPNPASPPPGQGVGVSKEDAEVAHLADERWKLSVARGVPFAGQVSSDQTERERQLHAEIDAADPAAKKQRLGEILYPLVSSSHPELAGKITGMLLQRENSELVPLCTGHVGGTSSALKTAILESVTTLDEIDAKLKLADKHDDETTLLNSKLKSARGLGAVRTILWTALAPLVRKKIEASCSSQLLGQRVPSRLVSPSSGGHLNTVTTDSVTDMLLMLDNAEIVKMATNDDEGLTLQSNIDACVIELRLHADWLVDHDRPRIYFSMDYSADWSSVAASKAYHNFCLNSQDLELIGNLQHGNGVPLTAESVLATRWLDLNDTNKALYDPRPRHPNVKCSYFHTPFDAYLQVNKGNESAPRAAPAVFELIRRWINFTAVEKDVYVEGLRAADSTSKIRGPGGMSESDFPAVTQTEQQRLDSLLSSYENEDAKEAKFLHGKFQTSWVKAALHLKCSTNGCNRKAVESGSTSCKTTLCNVCLEKHHAARAAAAQATAMAHTAASSPKDRAAPEHFKTPGSASSSVSADDSTTTSGGANPPSASSTADEFVSNSKRKRAAHNAKRSARVRSHTKQSLLKFKEQPGVAYAVVKPQDGHIAGKPPSPTAPRPAPPVSPRMIAADAGKACYIALQREGHPGPLQSLDQYEASAYLSTEALAGDWSFLDEHVRQRYREAAALEVTSDKFLERLGFHEPARRARVLGRPRWATCRHTHVPSKLPSAFSPRVVKPKPRPPLDTRGVFVPQGAGYVHHDTRAAAPLQHGTGYVSPQDGPELEKHAKFWGRAALHAAASPTRAAAPAAAPPQPRAPSGHADVAPAVPVPQPSPPVAQPSPPAQENDKMNAVLLQLLQSQRDLKRGMEEQASQAQANQDNLQQAMKKQKAEYVGQLDAQRTAMVQQSRHLAEKLLAKENENVRHRKMQQLAQDRLKQGLSAMQELVERSKATAAEDLAAHERVAEARQAALKRTMQAQIAALEARPAAEATVDECEGLDEATTMIQAELDAKYGTVGSAIVTHVRKLMAPIQRKIDSNPAYVLTDAEEFVQLVIEWQLLIENMTAPTRGSAIESVSLPDTAVPLLLVANRFRTIRRAQARGEEKEDPTQGEIDALKDFFVTMANQWTSHGIKPVLATHHTKNIGTVSFAIQARLKSTGVSGELILKAFDEAFEEAGAAEEAHGDGIGLASGGLGILSMLTGDTDHCLWEESQTDAIACVTATKTFAFLMQGSSESNESKRDNILLSVVNQATDSAGGGTGTYLDGYDKAVPNLLNASLEQASTISEAFNKPTRDSGLDALIKAVKFPSDDNRTAAQVALAKSKDPTVRSIIFTNIKSGLANKLKHMPTVRGFHQQLANRAVSCIRHFRLNESNELIAALIWCQWGSTALFEFLPKSVEKAKIKKDEDMSVLQVQRAWKCMSKIIEFMGWDCVQPLDHIARLESIFVGMEDRFNAAYERSQDPAVLLQFTGLMLRAYNEWGGYIRTWTAREGIKDRGFPVLKALHWLVSVDEEKPLFATVINTLTKALEQEQVEALFSLSSTQVPAAGAKQRADKSKAAEEKAANRKREADLKTAAKATADGGKPPDTTGQQQGSITTAKGIAIVKLEVWNSFKKRLEKPTKAKPAFLCWFDWNRHASGGCMDPNCKAPLHVGGGSNTAPCRKGAAGAKLFAANRLHVNAEIAKEYDNAKEPIVVEKGLKLPNSKYQRKPKGDGGKGGKARGKQHKSPSSKKQ